MNALLSFKRTPRLQPTSQQPDPLLESNVYLDEVTDLETVSTLKFLDIKREAEREANREPLHAELPQAARSTASAVQAVPQPSAKQPAGGPSRLQQFRQRVADERSDRLPLPFPSTRNWPVLDFTALGAAAPVLNAIDLIRPKPSCAVAQAESVALTSRFCLSRSSESLSDLLTDLLAQSDRRKPLHVQLPDADTFDFCSGSAELFTRTAASPAPHRLTEDDDTRMIRIAHAERLSLDCMTAAHPLRQRAAGDTAFAGWFTEDGFECDRGVSPIETFVQTEMLHLHQQTQRLLKQLQRLALHLQQHCPGLQAQAAMHDTRQADAWLRLYGDAPQPELYRLLDCTVRQMGDQPVAMTVQEAMCTAPVSLLRFCDMEVPNLPASLLLLRAIADFCANSNPPCRSSAAERLALLDLLIRKPAGCSDNRPVAAVPLTLPADLDAFDCLLRDRFAGLQSELKIRGLA